MKKQTKNLKVSKSRKERIKEDKLNLDAMKKEYKEKLSLAFDDLYNTFRDIPVLPMELHNIFFEIQKIQGWSNLFIDSLMEKQPVDDTSP